MTEREVLERRIATHHDARRGEHAMLSNWARLRRDGAHRDARLILGPRTHGGGCGPLVVGVLAVLLALALAASAGARVNRWKVVEPHNDRITRIASCETGGRWSTNTGNGFYGGLQFTLGTWRAAGGRGMPHLAPRIEQKYRAVLWARRIGFAWGSTAGWPVCGRR